MSTTDRNARQLAGEPPRNFAVFVPVTVVVDLDLTREAHLHGVAGRIMSAAIDGDLDQVADLINDNPGDAYAALILALGGLAHHTFGDDAAARRHFSLNATRADIDSIEGDLS